MTIWFVSKEELTQVSASNKMAEVTSHMYTTTPVVLQVHTPESELGSSEQLQHLEVLHTDGKKDERKNSTQNIFV